VYTDQGGRAPHGRFPDGVREVDLCSHLGSIDQDSAGRALVELIRSFRAEIVINVNSVLLYQAMNPYGKALAATQRIFLVMFCNEQLALGNWVGLPLRYFYRYVDLVEGVITDSAYLRDWLVELHQLPQETQDRLHVGQARDHLRAGLRHECPTRAHFRARSCRTMFGQPPAEAAIEHGHGVVFEPPQHPPQATGEHAGILIVGDDLRASVDAEVAERVAQRSGLGKRMSAVATRLRS